MDTAVNPNSQVYYSGTYWNDFPMVLEYMCENFTGDKSKWWVQDFQERFAQEPFENGLFVNCGNGWVEREFIDKGIVRKAIAFDYSSDLLLSAMDKKGNRPIDYFRTDVNRIFFKKNYFDLIVNVAALHHVQYINRLCWNLCKALIPKGIFVNFDYIGPHRNQYSLLNWALINLSNLTLSSKVRKSPLVKPHLPTMLYTDPTEAIHSELIFNTVEQYFDIVERHDTGGGIAYEILTHNNKLKNIPPHELNLEIEKILWIDKKLTSIKIIPPLFSYFIAKPQKKILHDFETIMLSQQQEEKREFWAKNHEGNYYIKQYFLFLLIKSIKPRLQSLAKLMKKRLWNTK
jgi:SAM-dependent methyltransferase